LAARTLSHGDVASKAAEASAHDPNGYPTTFAYQWTKNAVNIACATAPTLNLATANSTYRWT